MKKFLDIVDMQYSFIDPKGVLAIQGADVLVQKANSFLQAHANDFDVILFKQDTHFADEYLLSDEKNQFPLHCEYQSQDWELIIDLHKMKGKGPVFKLYKNVFDMWDQSQYDVRLVDKIKGYQDLYKVQNAFDGTYAYGNLDEMLQAYPAESTVIYLFGVASDYCVKYALEGYLKRGYQVRLLPELMKGIQQEIDEVVQQYLSEHRSQIEFVNDYSTLSLRE